MDGPIVQQVRYRPPAALRSHVASYTGYRLDRVAPGTHAGMMLGSAGRDHNPFSQRPTGAGSVYVVTDDPDGVYGRAIAGGATVFAELRDEDYGSRGFSVTDPEGNVWSFGTYRGEP